MAKIIETHTFWGREFTPEEIQKLDERRAKLISEGVTYLRSSMFNGVAIREWETEELANNFVEFANSMNPPPIKIEVVTYDDD